MQKRRFKPTQKNIDLSRTIAQNIEYYCKTSVLDEIVCKKKGIEFNKSLSGSLEAIVSYYFIVKTNSEYDVLPGPDFEKFLEEQGIKKELPLTQKAILCRDHYIKKFIL